MITLRSIKPIAALAGLLVACCTCGLADDTPDITAPPPDITATKTTLAQVLKSHVLAEGKLAKNIPHTVIQNSSYTVGALNGTDRYLSSGNDYRYDNTTGTFHYAYGISNGHSWYQNENGQVILEHGIHQRDEISSEALSKAEIRLIPSVTLLGEVSQPAPAYVVKIAPAGGRLEYLFIDKTTYLIVRKEYARKGHRVVTTYDDFRTTGGITTAWHTHSDDGNNISDSRTTSLQIGTPIDPASLAIPPTRALFTLSQPTERLPAKIVDDVIVLTTTVSGKSVNFVLDSGSSGILLDSDVINGLHLQTSGKFTGETAGKYAVRDALVPSITIGNITMNGVRVETAPFTQQTDDSTKVSGLMGFDFIANSVIHIDYENGNVEAIDPATFTPPPGATSVTVGLDDFVPTVSAIIGMARGNTFILDTGADRSTLFSGFVQDHPNDTRDQGLGEQMIASYPFVNVFYGVGGSISYRPIQIKPFAFAGHSFPEWLFTGTYDAPGFEFEDYDGLIGQDVLRNFDVYLDYPHLKIYFVPNDRFKQRWST